MEDPMKNFLLLEVGENKKKVAKVILFILRNFFK